MLLKRFSPPLIFLLAACSAYQTPVERAHDQYRNSRDYQSLELLSEHIHPGMPKDDVISILGEPDHEPSDGKVYYSSNTYVYSKKDNRDFAIGLILDYRTEKGDTSDTLQNFYIGQLKDADALVSHR